MDITYLLLIPAMLLAAWAQFKVSSSYKKYSGIRSLKGYTGADVSRALLRENGVNNVDVQPVAGQLTDHYDPSAKVIKLSQGIYDSTSIAALSVAAHETGHALQHATGYSPLNIRSAIVPVANISSKMAMPIFIAGMFLGNSGAILMNIGIILFLGAVIFQVVTLPVEFNASKRAIAMLESGNYITKEEVKPAKSMLDAAAMTYVAAAFMSLAQLLRLILLSNRRRR